MDAFLLVLAYAGLIIVYAFAERFAKELFAKRRNRYSCRQESNKDMHTEVTMKRSA